jgi:hypothetical protein
MLSNGAVNVSAAIEAEENVKELLKKKHATRDKFLEAMFSMRSAQGYIIYIYIYRERERERERAREQGPKRNCQWLALETVSLLSVRNSQWWPDAARSHWSGFAAMRENGAVGSR